ncbi:MAG TPA: hypothetical protein DCZ95_06235 [Verrucomicrobia bacterium]|nr:MAG: hypothetical protein A2X46_08350 [Lentisphaerae bacterium GWF2_57_35]HBA83677.1 hypothetical protein [Verrucomicrobiota bacterium]
MVNKAKRNALIVLGLGLALVCVLWWRQGLSAPSLAVPLDSQPADDSSRRAFATPARSDSLDPSQQVIQPQILTAETARPPQFTISLQNTVLDTSISSPAGLTAKDLRGRPQSVMQSRQQPTARRTLPYLVQFQGTIQESWKSEVEAAGGILRGYVPNNAFLVELNETAFQQVSDLPSVQWVGEYKPNYKIQSVLSQLAESGASDATIPVSIQTFAPGDAEALAERIRTLGAGIEGVVAGKRWGMVRAELPVGKILEVAELGAVQWIEEYVKPVLLNDFSVRSDHMNVTNVWTAHGLTGAGQVIGHADTGLDIGNTNGIHPDFSGRIRAAFALGRIGYWGDTNSHGTHTAGSILGSGAASAGQFRGVAYEAQLVHQSVMDLGGYLSGLPDDLNDLFYQTYTNDARIHSDSWGSSVYLGAYTIDSRYCDEFMWDHPDMLLVFSAGNNGIDANRNGVIDPNSVSAPGTAKSMLTVGATENDRAPGSGGYSSLTYGGAWPSDYPVAPLNGDYISQSADGLHQGACTFSSRGPTDDGRIKPDIVAPGTDVISCRSRVTGYVGWGTNANTNYLFMGGTSMATPLTAGAAALVRQYCQEYAGLTNPSAALLKAILISGARTLTPGQHGTNEFREIPASPRPNNVEGWGQVNLEETLFPAVPAGVILIDSASALTAGATNEHVIYVAGTNTRLTVIMAYSDYPATAGSGVKLVNDLDLTLVTPDETVRYPNGRGSPDRTNNVEGLDLDELVPGFYRVQISGHNVPQGPQAYALVARGAVQSMPKIEHTPLPNTYVTNQPYTVDADVWSDLPFDTGSVRVVWNTLGAEGAFQSNVMTWVSNRTFRGFIPAQPNLTEIFYYIAAGQTGIANVSPAGAPSNLYQFSITQPVELMVNGSPSALFTVSPGYGSQILAVGSEVQAWATPSMPVSAGKRVACAGWVGAGSVPAWGATNEASFVIEEPSILEWQWQIQYALYQTSSVPGVVSATTWWSLMSYAETLTAPFSYGAGGTNYMFAQWMLDGWRQPDAGSIAVNPVQNIYMYAAHSAVARYYPESEDSNGDGMADWWEYRYFGSLSTVSNQDFDSDGFVNYEEALDWTNPKDAGSFPHAPVIQHEALSVTQTSPAPWMVSAVITDNCRVASAVLWWRRNAGPWQEAAMSLDANSGSYRQSIASPGIDGDLFSYRLEAADPLGLAATNGPYSFEVHYPSLTLTPSPLGPVLLPAMTVSNVPLTAFNDGTGLLNWRMETADCGFFDDVESGTNGWTHSGQNDLWTVWTGRWSSASHAWYCGNPVSRQYVDSMNASLVTPPVRLGMGARLTFNQWAYMEYDTDVNDNHYWDGAVVEISTNAGGSFQMLVPEGGYPNLITDNPNSPFPPETPCLADTGLWSTVAFDLADFAGQEVRIRFRFGSDGLVVEEGWYLDDIAITPITGTNDWLSLTETQGVVAANSYGQPLATLDTTPLALAETRHAVLLFYHNDPLQASPIGVPVALHNNSRIVEVSSIGPGTVNPSGTVYVLSGQTSYFLVSAAAYNHIAAVFTNGGLLSGFVPCAATNVMWEDIVSNGTFSAVFALNVATNGTPEWWLAQYGLTNATPDEESIFDQDADGLLTWQEYLVGTNPTNPASRALVITGIGERPELAESVVLRWLSFTNAGFAYDVYLSTNLVAGFQPYATNLPATPPINAFTTTLDGASSRFYIIQVSP